MQLDIRIQLLNEIQQFFARRVQPGRGRPFHHALPVETLLVQTYVTRIGEMSDVLDQGIRFHYSLKWILDITVKSVNNLSDADQCFFNGLANEPPPFPFLSLLDIRQNVVRKDCNTRQLSGNGIMHLRSYCGASLQPTELSFRFDSSVGLVFPT